MRIFKQFIKKLIISITHSLSKTRVGILVGLTLFEEVRERVLKKYLMNNVKSINHNGIEMQFSVPNQLNKFRVDTFSTKEPETLDWIDSFAEDSILWDIGANIGLFSVYAAKSKKCKVFAFEPSVFNLELLARNINLNNLNEQILIMPIALSETISLDQMRFTSTDWGGALSTFGKDIGWDGKSISDIFSFKTISCSMDQAASFFKLPLPDHIKIDVDGIEHFILQGGKNILKSVNSVLIEINDDFKDQALCAKEFLKDAGLSFKEKKHSPMFKNSRFSSFYNQIWSRS